MADTHTPLSVNLCGITLTNPTILASGILGLDTATLTRVAKSGAGAVTMKSLTSEPRKGHNNPILTEVEGGFLNAVGYANKGINHGMQEFAPWNSKIPLIGSIVGSTTKELCTLTEKIQTLPIAALEIALSCPHTPGFGLLAGQGTPEATSEITRAVKKLVKPTIPLIIKLSPSVEAIGDIAKAAEAEGADIINMGNTLGPGMKINIARAQPVLDFRVGGMSGPAIKPITIRSIYDLYKAVQIPLIATGGITYGEDAIEAIQAGATAVGIGTAVYYRGIEAFKKVANEMKIWMKEHTYSSLEELRGLAHQEK